MSPTFTLKRILLPVDFSQRSAGAAHYATRLVSRLGAEVILLHVLPPLDPAVDEPGTLPVEVYRARRDQAAAELEQFHQTELKNIPTFNEVADGDPAARILDTARERQIDLILMPTHGYGPFRRFLLGSNTAKVLHEAECPVWTGVHIHEVAAGAPLPMDNVLCAVDLGPQSARALCWASQFAAAFGARLSIVHATGPEPDDVDAEVPQRGIRDAAIAELEKLQQTVGVDAERIIESGDAPKVICAVAERRGADLLVTGRGSASGVFGRLRTNGPAIIRMAPCPVVSV